MRCASAVGADQDLAIERPLVEPAERQVEHCDMIGGGVRAGVAGPEDPGRRLARLSPREQTNGWWPEPPLKFPAAGSFSE